MSVIDNAVYLNGVRCSEPPTVDVTFDEMSRTGGMGWIGFYRPTHQEIEAVAAEFNLHPLAVEDAVTAHQRPKIERYDDMLFTVLRPAIYDDEQERVEFGELHVFTGPNFVVTIRHAEKPDLAAVRHRMEATPELLALGPEAVLYAIFDQVVDDYGPVVDGLAEDIDEIELQVFDGDPRVSRRIYELLREVIALQRATQPLVDMMDALRDGFDKYDVDPELRRLLRDVEDHSIRVIERVDAFRSLLESMLTVNSSLVAQRQNEDVKRISSWAAIGLVPTLVASIYGMNFRHMPELAWPLGYPMALALMATCALVLYFVFKRNNWL